ncbi:hypothetical protein QMK33_10890 [Hymenobacter sp. H14-R3]|uniref:hypothetical protein n=1 Tax=Hymenobacter sp. H14-R3 TaxID=3046308 RepID=UPI0024BB2A6C|nr:hypothetical protein [Hymenobacter sp. H14-R3]MDJ0365659.1 hypothetical protein [Hymenobacter sp. H14-R3]
MKHFFTCLLSLLLLAHAARAQSPDPVRQKFNNVFARLDKSQVPTGRLLEAAVPLAYLPGFSKATLTF